MLYITGWFTGALSGSASLFFFSPLAAGKHIPCSPRTPAAASGAGFGGAKPPSNRFVFTHRFLYRAGTLDVGGQNVSLGTFADTASGLVTSSVAGGSLTASITSSSASMFLGSLSTNLTLASGSAAANISGRFYNVGNGIFNNASASILNLNGSVMNGGNLTLNNNGNAVSGITVSNVINNAGWILSSGTGTTPGTVATSSATSVGAGVLISATIGSNVTTVTQNSAHTPLELLNANTFTGSATILSGTMILGNATAASSSQILVGDTTGSANTSLLELSGLTVANNILVQAGSTGTSTIGSLPSRCVTKRDITPWRSTVTSAVADRNGMRTWKRAVSPGS